MVNQNPEDFSMNMPELSPEITEKTKQEIELLKTDATKLKTKILTSYKKYIKGIVVLPPRKENLAGDPVDKDKKYVLVLYDDSTIKKIEDKITLRKKMQLSIDTSSKKINPNLIVELMSLYELRENCFDGRWEIMKHISFGLHVYDPYEWLAAIKVSEIHKQMVLEKFEKYIVTYATAGSFFRGEKANDIDVFIVVDDTDVKRMPRMELRDRLRAIIVQQSFEAARLAGVKKEFHIQAYILTDYWESLKDAHPVIFTMLRDAVPLYDRGVFMPWKLLLKQGRIRPSPEFIDMQMNIGEKLIERTRFKMLSVVSEELYYALLNPAQAALMLYGANPPTPKEAINLLREIFVKKEKYLEDKYVKTLEEVRNYYKKIEHGKVKEVSGAEIDRLLENAREYLKKLDIIFKKLQKQKDKEKIKQIYSEAITSTRDVLKILGYKGEIMASFRKACTKKELSKKSYETLKLIEKMKKGGLKKAELQNAMREARIFIRDMSDIVQKKKIEDMQKMRVKIKYGNNIAELYFVGNNKAYIIRQEEDRIIEKAEISANGSIKNIKKATNSEFEHAITNSKHSEDICIKEGTLKSLKALFGKDTRVIVSQ